MDMGIAGKTAVVTGGTGGIGRGIAEALAAEGARVVVIGRNVQRGADCCRQLAQLVEFVCGDVTNSESLEQITQEIHQRGWSIDILVNNVGGLVNLVGGERSCFGVPDVDWSGTFSKVVISAVAVSRLFVPTMITAGWGRVINVASIAATEPPPSTPSAYGAAKAALRNATFSLAHALSGTGVTANTVSPGPIITDELVKHIRKLGCDRRWVGDWAELERCYLREIRPNAVGRIGRPEDVGRAVAFLASEHASYITGSDLRIDGGSCRAVA